EVNKFRYVILMLLFLMFHQGGLFGQNKNISEVEDAFKFIKERGEVNIYFELKDKNLINTISKIISVTSVDNNMVFGNVNEKELYQFLKFNLDFKVIPPAFPKTIETSKSLGVLQAWQTYPTYDQYDSLMGKFATDYPEICKLDTIGYSEEGRNILFVKISDNVNEKEDEPEFLFSSTMHGDETGGYVLMLRYIDYLLNNYGSDSLVTSLVDEIEIWINPLANPDGTYAGGNHTIYGATRRNTNGVDLNRNFPDPEDGPHPDGNDYQAETIVMMDFMEEHNFILSANFHSRAEVVNYPWDTWSRRHPDDDFFQFISHEYADTAQAYSTGYMTGFNDGITNGWDWYSIAGGRQDYVTYFLHGREVTIELDNTKITLESELENLWNYNYRSFLNYAKQCLFGIRGTVIDSITGNPLRVKIELLDHDQDSSHVYSDTTDGNYYRLIHEGTYNLKFSAPGYYEKYIDSIIVENRKATELDVQLVPLNHTNIFRKYPIQFKLNLYPNPARTFVHLAFELPNPSMITVELYDILGNRISRVGLRKYPVGNNQITLNITELSRGIYFVRLKIDGKPVDKKIIKL
ncbi:MAG: T9SS type A sorting domain-containing protein, partial [Bacteroidales bacterium]|nr:T9SS type A sorting domain-containing protein [Bacteroidales bacterium]